MNVICEIDREDLVAATTWLRQVEVRPSGPAIAARLEAIADELRAGRAGLTEERRRAIRKLLKHGKYRATGRGKPAQEYLAKVFAERGTIDSINNVVDVNNLVSLRSGLPISAFDVERLEGPVVLRHGRDDERYVFNASGQVLACRDLLVVCDSRGPVGSPVKDSQATKVFPGATSVLYVVYGSRETIDDEGMLAVARELGEALIEDCPTAEVVRIDLLTSPSAR